MPKSNETLAVLVPPALAVLALMIAAGSATVCKIYHSRVQSLQDEIALCEKKRSEERKGRIRAEVRLREVLKCQQPSMPHADERRHGMMVQRIGIVTSP